MERLNEVGSDRSSDTRRWIRCAEQFASILDALSQEDESQALHLISAAAAALGRPPELN
jgi:hypothetical protein